MKNYEVIPLIRNKYLSNHKENTLKHVEEVSDTAVWLAKMYHLDIAKVKIAALLHDISAIMTPQEMYEMAKARELEIDPAEEKYHFLLHQRISKIIAREYFDILGSKRCTAIL